jgi:hypothetical protein
MPAQFVGLRNDQDGLTGNDAIRVTRGGAQVVAQAHGQYLESAIRGRVYTGSCAAAGIIPLVAATTGGHPTLWNPSDSGRYVSVIRLRLGYVSENNAPTCLSWASTLNTGSAAGTGLAIATATLVAPVGVVGGALDYKAKWSPTTNTFTAAPTFFRSIGISLFTGIATTAVAPFQLEAAYDGDLVLAPGAAISLCSAASTATTKFQISITWEEIAI